MWTAKLSEMWTRVSYAL